MSYSPQTGLVYIPIQDGAIDFTHDPGYTRLQGFQNLGVLIGTLPDDPQVRKAIRNGYRGALLAWDPVARGAAWRVERRGAYNGGTLAVAGGIVFQGTIDGHFLAVDAKTGKELWSFDNQAATLAGPVSYEVDGEQYVSVPAGYGGVLPDQWFVPAPGGLADQRARLHVQAGRVGAQASHPVRTHPDAEAAGTDRDPDQYRRGALLYDTFCLNCHGIAAITGGVLPDLRKSGRLQDAVLWKAAVVDEELASRACRASAGIISAADAELIRAYVARQAGLLFNQEQVAPVTAKTLISSKVGYRTRKTVCTRSQGSCHTHNIDDEAPRTAKSSGAVLKAALPWRPEFPTGMAMYCLPSTI